MNDLKTWQETQCLFADEDIIYHYTKRAIALESILHNGEIWLSQRSGTDDPFEKRYRSPTRSWYGIDMLERHRDKKREREVLDILDTTLCSKNLKVLSFCANHKFLETNPEGHEINDRLGLLKSRIWSQYGDKYGGICLAFSKSKLLAQLKEKFPRNSFFGQIEYLPFDKIDAATTHIDATGMANHDAEDFVKKFLEKNYKRLFFTKHRDYRDENEFRLCVIDKENPSDPIRLKINDGLLGIVTNYNIFPDAYLKMVSELSIKFNARWLEVDWNTCVPKIHLVPREGYP